MCATNPLFDRDIEISNFGRVRFMSKVTVLGKKLGQLSRGRVASVRDAVHHETDPVFDQRRPLAARRPPRASLTPYLI